jgi:hypothetical protein
LRHVFWDASQYMPVVSAPVHAMFPQMQGAALLGADPSVFVQAGAVRVHMHVSSVEQDNPVDPSVLNNRVPEESFQHPGGLSDHEMTIAVVCVHPSALAPSSHSAWSPTHRSQVSSAQDPDVLASNTVNRPSLLHVLSAAMQNIPVVRAVSQSADPHAQADGLAAEPSVMAQTGPARHLF